MAGARALYLHTMGSKNDLPLDLNENLLKLTKNFYLNLPKDHRSSKSKSDTYKTLNKAVSNWIDIKDLG